MVKEIWKDIPNYEGYYQVSNLGNIKSLPRLVSNHVGGLYYTKERILRPRPDTQGYHLVQLYKENKSRVFLIHRLVAQAFIPNPYNLPQVNHKFGIKPDNRASELEWCDQFYNMKHAIENNLAKKPPIKYGKDNIKARKVIDTNTGKVYDTIRDAIKDLNISRHKAYMILSRKHTIFNNLTYA